MQINSLQASTATNSIANSSKPRAAESVDAAAPAQQAGDQIEFSAEAQQILNSQGASDIRSEKVAEIKAAIDNGTYETEEKLSAALDKMLDSFA